MEKPDRGKDELVFRESDYSNLGQYRFWAIEGTRAIKETKIDLGFIMKSGLDEALVFNQATGRGLRIEHLEQILQKMKDIRDGKEDNKETSAST